jgi:Domain of unknown function (DUF5916)/Carbohydrate family 9 binding domain-like
MSKLIPFILGFLPYILFAQNDSLGDQLNNQTDFKVLIQQAVKPIVVDGVLDEYDWSIAKPAKDFWMKYPNNTKRAETKTEVRLTNDDHNIYIGIICYDSSRNHIIQTLKRDVNYFDGDGVAVVLDPVNRMSNAYLFGVSPQGVQSDAAVQFFGDPVWSWDTKWSSVVKQYDDRWVVEMAIPFKSLRYEAGEKTWGINFIRNDIKKGQYQTWARVPVQFFGYSLGYYGSLEWEWSPPIEISNVTLIPYMLGGVSADYQNGQKTDKILRGGADAKIALNSQLNLDATINPDFSQVDVDQQVTNLTRFNLFFPERRTFFLENSDVLSELGSPMSRPFFSRRIGLDANGQRVPIQFGARLSGNLTKSTRINAFDMQTGATDGQKSYNYFAAAVQQALVGRSFIKVAAMNRQDMTNYTKRNTEYIREVSSEISFTSKNNLWDGWALAHHSFQNKPTDQNNFFEGGVWYHNDKWQLLLDYIDIGSNYTTGMEFFNRLESHDDLLDTTYRVGYKQGFVQFLHNYIPKGNSKVAQNRFNMNNIIVYNPNGSFNNRILQIENTIQFRNTSQIVLGLYNEDNQLPINVAFTDYLPLPPARYKFTNFTAQYSSDIRKLFNYTAQATVGEFYNGQQRSVSVGINYRKTPWGLFGLRLERYDLQFPEPHKQSLLYLINSKAEFSFTKNFIWTTFFQYNTQADNFNINSRVQWRYKPMSDIFIVYSDNYAVQPFLKKNRGLVVKMNYWFNL